jgi:ADP-ribosylglycohydrolase
MTNGQIHQRFGPGGIRDFAPAYGRISTITDDTQMALFTAEGLLRAAVRQAGAGSCDVPTLVHQAYVRWLRTQGCDPPRFNSELVTEGWLTDGRLIGPRTL